MSLGIEETRVHELLTRLWPLNRSLTGPGVRETLDVLGEIMPIERLRFATGETAFDWTVPQEWSVTEAYFEDASGNRHAEFSQNNLHLVGYSEAFEGTVDLEELKKHLFTLPGQPDAIPYVTSYYHKRWGFCLTQKAMEALPAGLYKVVIRAEKSPGHLEIGEVVLPGETEEEILFSTYICHPSMANNELSGPVVMTFLYEHLRALPRRRYTYRFVFSIETLGTICYLSRRGEHLKENVKAGYQLTCLGDRGGFSLKTSRRGDTLADRAALTILRDLGGGTIYGFDPADGSDERQYCSQGFNLPVASLMRTKYGEFAEYHTSLDNLDFISTASLIESVEAYAQIAHALETNYAPQSHFPFGEPMLGKRDLYPKHGVVSLEDEQKAIMWVLNLADSEHDLLAIAQRSGLPYRAIALAAARLADKEVISRARLEPPPVAEPAF